MFLGKKTKLRIIIALLLAGACISSCAKKEADTKPDQTASVDVKEKEDKSAKKWVLEASYSDTLYPGEKIDRDKISVVKKYETGEEERVTGYKVPGLSSVKTITKSEVFQVQTKHGTCDLPINVHVPSDFYLKNELTMYEGNDYIGQEVDVLVKYDSEKTDQVKGVITEVKAGKSDSPYKNVIVKTKLYGEIAAQAKYVGIKEISVIANGKVYTNTKPEDIDIHTIIVFYNDDTERMMTRSEYEKDGHFKVTVPQTLVLGNNNVTVKVSSGNKYTATIYALPEGE